MNLKTDLLEFSYIPDLSVLHGILRDTADNEHSNK